LGAAIAAGEFFAIVSASSWARVRSSAAGTTSLIMPSSRARDAGIRSCRPTRAIRMTASNGILRSSPIASGATTWPTDTCGSKNWASSAAMTTSASATQWKPPPAQIPFTAVITGLATFWCQAVKCRSQFSIDSRYRSMPTPSLASSATSTPVWNARPSPVCTMTRTSGSLSSSSQAPASSSRMAAFIAFSASGRLNSSQPTGPRRSSFRVLYEVSLTRGPPGRATATA
jgi:hypothetical protein